MESDLLDLHEKLIRLHHELRAQTYDKYKRINPFMEDLFDWKERGEFWLHRKNNVTIYNSTSIVGDVTIGDNTWIGPDCALDGEGGLNIGSYCSIAAGCKILTHDSVKWALSGGRQPYERSPTKIGNCCFLGMHVVVTRGVTIGNHCLIGAGSVVTHDILDYSIAAGVPARIIGTVKIEGDSVRLLYEEKE